MLSFWKKREFGETWMTMVEIGFDGILLVVLWAPFFSRVFGDRGVDVEFILISVLGIYQIFLFLFLKILSSLDI